jgi:hypothetical protein
VLARVPLRPRSAPRCVLVAFALRLRRSAAGCVCSPAVCAAVRPLGLRSAAAPQCGLEALVCGCAAARPRAPPWCVPRPCWAGVGGPRARNHFSGGIECSSSRTCTVVNWLPRHSGLLRPVPRPSPGHPSRHRALLLHCSKPRRRQKRRIFVLICIHLLCVHTLTGSALQVVFGPCSLVKRGGISGSRHLAVDSHTILHITQLHLFRRETLHTLNI